MHDVELEPGLIVKRCPESAGCWISSAAYWLWQQELQAASGPLRADDPVASDDRGRGALLCPESGTILLRYRVALALPFFVERSPATGGVWLDRGEWQALKQFGLHNRLHLIFTGVYQERLRREEVQQAREAGLRRLLGADFPVVADLRAWLLGHPARARVLAWLQQQD